MEWYYAEAGEQRGPVSDEQLRELAGARKVEPSTLVWRAGMETWLPYGSMQAGPPPVITPGEGMAQCAECGRAFSTGDMIRLGNSWVCAACKPLFLQRLAEGAPPPALLQLWRSGPTLVMNKAATLPDRCVKCNTPAQGRRLKRNLYWHSPYLYLLVLLNLLIYLIVAIIVRKRAKIEIGICDRHLAQRRTAIAIGWLLGLGGPALVIASIANSSGGVALLGLLLFIVGLIVGAVKGPVVSAKRIDEEVIWVKGVCRPYLDTLPEWTANT